MDNLEKFKKLADVRELLLNTSSMTKKREILLDYKNNSDKDFNEKVFDLITNNHIKFYVTASKVKSMYAIRRVGDEEPIATDEGILNLYDMLAKRQLTGNAALTACALMCDALLDIDIYVAQLFLDILDKDFKCGVSNSTIQAIFGGEDTAIKRNFGVALANKYFDRADKVDFEKQDWYASRKCDGLRCICIKENGVVKFFSRQEKEFTTLGVLKELVELCEDDNFVLDGELCQVDANGDEDFQGIIKLARRKDYTIPDPFYQLFDMLTVDEFFGRATSPNFNARIQRLNAFFSKNKTLLENNFKVLKQTHVEDINHFNELCDEARSKNWEGIMIRRDVPYEGKRTNDLLKVKDFLDDEFTVIDYELGDMRMVENGKHVTRQVLTNVVIDYKGNRVSVGSGFSKEQRIHFAEHPEDILGHTITVKYFEETTNQRGTASMRFPVVKYVYDNNGRTV